jgi:hypothetical protein
LQQRKLYDKSVEIDREKGKKGLERELKFPVVELDRSGQRVGFRANGGVG